MKNIMNKVSIWWSNLSNTTKIRTGMSVRDRIEAINIGILTCIAGIISFIIIAHVEKEMYFPLLFAAACICCIATWLFGLRKAIAMSQEARQSYLEKSKVRFRRACKRFGNLCLGLVIAGAGIIAMVIAFAICIKMNAISAEFLTMFPALESLADNIVTNLNTMLEKLLTMIR